MPASSFGISADRLSLGHVPSVPSQPRRRYMRREPKRLHVQTYRLSPHSETLEHPESSMRRRNEDTHPSDAGRTDLSWDYRPGSDTDPRPALSRARRHQHGRRSPQATERNGSRRRRDSTCGGQLVPANAWRSGTQCECTSRGPCALGSASPHSVVSVFSALWALARPMRPLSAGSAQATCPR